MAQPADWHHAGRPSNGRIEGTNNLLQVLRRRAHGFTNYANFEARGLLLTNPPSPAAESQRRDEGSVISARHADRLEPRVVSLPVATFAPTGTTVKTSIVFLCKAVPPLPPQVFFARANHVGHVVRKGATIADPQGDDLPDIADDVCEIIAGRRPQGSKVEMSERSDLCSVIPAGGQRNPEAADRLRSIGGQPLSSMLRVAPKQRGPVASDAPFVSVLHVDALGCIDWQAAQQHHPTTAGVIATSGQVIVSLLNPAKFRASVIPDGHDQVQCSSEFGVFDPLIDPYAALALLQHPLVREQVAPLGRGSSSSRRRINAGDLLGCIAPSYDPDEIDQMARPVREAMSAVAIGRSALAKAFST